MRVFAFSDLHVDYAANLSDIRALSRTHYRDDTLLPASIPQLVISGHIEHLRKLVA